MPQNEFGRYWTANLKDGRLVYRQVSRNKRFYNLIISYLGSKKEGALRVLEVGCGTAIDSYYLKETIEADIFAMDSSKEAITQAQRIRRYFNRPINLIISDVENNCFKDETFDLIFSQGVMEHFMDYKNAYLEQLRVLKKGGILVVNVPQIYNFYSIISFLRTKINNRFGWELPYAVKDMKNVAKEFKVNLLKFQGQDFFSLEICRFFNTELLAEEPLNHSIELGGIHRYFNLLINIIERVLWQSVGRAFGSYIMMNIVGVFRK